VLHTPNSRPNVALEDQELNSSLQIEEVAVAISFKRMKSIRLRVCAPSGDVKLSAPRGVSQDVVRRFVEAKLPWIRDHRQKIRNCPPVRVWQRFDKATQQQYRAQLLEQLPPLIARYEKLLDVSVASFNLRHMKTRWGSCHTRKRHICFNLELARYPLAQLEYVIAHELAHLRVAAHNHRFYALLDEVMPDWRERKKLFRDGLGL
jgi:predicted metal-dependent hydrolase